MDSVTLTPAPIAKTAVRPPRSSHSRRLSLRCNFAWTLVGTAVYGACQWGMLIALAKLGSPEMVGQFVLGLAVTGPIFMLANLQLRPVQATDVRGEFRFGDYFGLRLVTTVLALFAVSAVGAIGGWRPELLIVILLIGGAKAVESFSDLCYGQLQQQERMDRVSLSMIARGILGVAFLSGIVLVTGSTAWGVVGLLFAWTIVLILWDAPRCRASVRVAERTRLFANTMSASSDPSLRPAILKKLLRICLPVGIGVFLASLTINLPRYFVEHWHGTEALGYFGSIAYVAVGGVTLIGALSQSARPTLARLLHEKPAAYRRLVWKLLSLAAAGGTVAVAVALLGGREILSVLYSGDYAAYDTTFVWVMLAVGLLSLSTIMLAVLQAARIFYPQAVVSGVSLVAAALFCWLFIRDGGVEGAGIAMAAYSLIALAVTAVWFVRSFPKREQGGIG